jgi:hypothetical protein
MQHMHAPARFARLQRDFADAVLRGGIELPDAVTCRTPSATESRFGVYRNNVIASLTRAVAARYPVVRRLLCDESFDALARLYVAAEPPRSPVLLEYGDSFPRFIRGFGQEASLHFVADIAALESARRHAYHAADAVPVGREAFAALAPEAFADLRFVLHPSVVLLTSRFPIVSIWQANQQGGDNAIDIWRPESALLARPGLEVTIWRLSEGAYRFFTVIAEGLTVASAIQAASDQVPDSDLTECLTTLIAADIVVGMKRPAGSRAAHGKLHKT